MRATSFGCCATSVLAKRERVVRRRVGEDLPERVERGRRSASSPCRTRRTSPSRRRRTSSSSSASRRACRRARTRPPGSPSASRGRRPGSGRRSGSRLSHERRRVRVARVDVPVEERARRARRARGRTCRARARRARPPRRTAKARAAPSLVMNGPEVGSTSGRPSPSASTKGAGTLPFDERHDRRSRAPSRCAM